MKERILKILRYTLIGFFGSLVLSFLYYVVFSLLFSTDVEKNLKRENRMYARELPKAEMAADLVRDELDFLQLRDESIYSQVFKAELPHVDDMLEGKPVDALATAGDIDRIWKEVFDTLGRGNALPPMGLPVDNLAYTNVGASTGERMNPFYKMKMNHDGIDLVAPEGTEVHATSSGTVTKVSTSTGGRGNMVEIRHQGGYVTRYAHLQQAAVRQGEYVRKGKVIGYVGDSGRAFTTHLHYEVARYGEILDPTHFFLGMLTPTEYLDFLIMSVSSGQSMD